MKNFEDPMEPVDWKAMYMILLGGITDAIDICPDKTTIGVLIKAMLDAEEYYINISEAVNGIPEMTSAEKKQWELCRAHFLQATSGESSAI